MRMRTVAIALMAVVALAAVTGCTGATQATTPTATADEPGTLVVYSTRNEKFVDPLLAKFEADTGIKVQALSAGDAVVNRLQEEANNVQADIVISNDVGSLEFLRLEGLLASAGDIEGVDSIDAKYRAEDNSWIGLSARTRVFIYNKDLITEEEMPKTVWELTDPKWQGKFAITRGGNGSMIAHVSALRNEWGDEKTEEWIRKVKDNAGAITEGHGDIRKAVGAGEFAFGMVNNYYFHQQLLEPTDNNVAAIYPDQGDSDMGAVVNAAGVGAVAGGPNPAAARAFLEWVLLPENQREFSFASLEVPLNPEIEAATDARPIDSYKVNSMPLSRLGEVWVDTRDLIERAGLDIELK